eukprot:831061-Prorocentrum_minimum.AAC.3
MTNVFNRNNSEDKRPDNQERILTSERVPKRAFGREFNSLRKRIVIGASQPAGRRTKAHCRTVSCSTARRACQTVT